MQTTADAEALYRCYDRLFALPHLTPCIQLHRRILSSRNHIDNRFSDAFFNIKACTECLITHGADYNHVRVRILIRQLDKFAQIFHQLLVECISGLRAVDNHPAYFSCFLI